MKNRCWLSDGVHAMHLPAAVVRTLCDALGPSPGGPGVMYYKPMALAIPQTDKLVDVVVCRFVKSGGQFKKGQFAVYLRSEWDTAKHPL